MRLAFILWTSQACAGAGTAGAKQVEVCSSERQAKLGAPHHGFRQACYLHEVADDGTLVSEQWLFDTDERGYPPGRSPWEATVGWQQTRFLAGCLQYGGWYRHCGWQLHTNLRHDERLVERLVERGLLVGEERVNKRGERFTLYTVADPDLVRQIIRDGGRVPVDAVRSGKVK